MKNISFAVLLISTISFALSAIYTFIQGSVLSLQAILALWASVIFGILTALFGKINNFFKQAAAIPDRNSNSTQETNGFIASLQEIIVDWNGFLKTAGNLSVIDLLNMAGIRLLSFSSLFLALLKGQRRQSYEFLDEVQKTDVLARKLKQKYGDLDELEDCQKINVVNNFILEVVPRSRDFWQTKHDISLPDYLIPTPEMEQVAIDATQTPTTLWFDEDCTKGQQELDTVIACGQFTMCFTLLRLIEEIGQRPNTNLTPEIIKVRDHALKIWQQLQHNRLYWVDSKRQQAISEWSK